MKIYNVIIVYSSDRSSILMCHRKKSPYKGLKNLVGGKVEENEVGIDAAYRELMEETHIHSSDITLHHVMDFTYHINQIQLEVYAGRLAKTIDVYGDENKLEWIKLSADFFDSEQFAGEGNIGHMLEQVNMNKEVILGR